MPQKQRKSKRDTQVSNTGIKNEKNAVNVDLGVDFG
jgi:hypothetical protein